MSIVEEVEGNNNSASQSLKLHCVQKRDGWWTRLASSLRQPVSKEIHREVYPKWVKCHLLFDGRVTYLTVSMFFQSTTRTLENEKRPAVAVIVASLLGIVIQVGRQERSSFAINVLKVKEAWLLNRQSRQEEAELFWASRMELMRVSSGNDRDCLSKWLWYLNHLVLAFHATSNDKWVLTSHIWWLLSYNTYLQRL